MNCSCVYVDVDDAPTFFLENKPIARKQHKCNECKRIIEIGEQYESVSGVWNGRFAIYKTCLDCVSIREAFFCDGYHYQEVLWDLYEHIQDVDGDISESCLAVLTPKAREKVCGMIEEIWEDREYD